MSDNAVDSYAGILSRVGLACIGFAVIAHSLLGLNQGDPVDDDDIYEWYENAAHLLLAADRSLVPRPGEEMPFFDLAIELVTSLRIFYHWTDDYLKDKTDVDTLTDFEDLFGDESALNQESFERAMRWSWHLAPEADWGHLFQE